MNATNDGGPAFPAQDWQAKGNHHPGMSLRDWFAGQEKLAEFDSPNATAPRGMAEALAGRPIPEYGACNTSEQWLAMLQWEADWRARLKFIRADAMLRAREGSQIANPTDELPDEHWHKIQTRPSLSWHPTREWEAACEMRGKMMYGRGKTIAAAQAALRAEWEGGGK